MLLFGSIFTHLILAVTLVLAAAVAGLMAYHYAKARLRERQGYTYDPEAEDPVQPSAADQRAKSAEEIAQIRSRIEALMEQQHIRSETQSQHLAQKLDEIRTHMSTQDRKMDGLKSELRHEIRRRDGELDELRLQLAGALDAFWKSMPALPEGAAHALPPALPPAPSEEPAPHAAPSPSEATTTPWTAPSAHAPADVPDTWASPFAEIPLEDTPTAAYEEGSTGAEAASAGTTPLEEPSYEEPRFEEVPFEGFSFSEIPLEEAGSEPLPPDETGLQDEIAFEEATWEEPTFEEPTMDDLTLEEPASTSPPAPEPTSAATPSPAPAAWASPFASGDGAAASTPPAAPPEPEAPPAPIEGDDLTAISGITPEIQQRLYGAGVTSLDEMARWSRADARRISGLLGVSEEVIMHQWIFEAQSVLFEHYQSMMTQ